MNHIEQFIKDAVEGGWRKDLDWAFIKGNFSINDQKGILLDKDAWIAVGKTRGWNRFSPEIHAEAMFNGFAHHLFSGHDINTALGLIDKE